TVKFVGLGEDLGQANPVGRCCRAAHSLAFSFRVPLNSYGKAHEIRWQGRYLGGAAAPLHRDCSQTNRAGSKQGACASRRFFVH
ncbi:MAG: hypothetical protein ACLQVW_22895, partial [Limisphaerales bacterium]